MENFLNFCSVNSSYNIHTKSINFESYRLFLYWAKWTRKLTKGIVFQVFFFSEKFSACLWKSYSQKETLPKSLKFEKLFQNQKRLILENIHPWNENFIFLGQNIILQGKHTKTLEFHCPSSKKWFLVLDRSKKLVFVLLL